MEGSEQFGGVRCELSCCVNKSPSDWEKHTLDAEIKKASKNVLCMMDFEIVNCQFSQHVFLH